MATKGAAVHVYGDWDGSGIKKASRDLSAFQKQAKGFSASVTKGFVGLGASIGGALALGTLVDQFKQMAMAAADDQKTVVALGKAMSNLGIGAQTAAMEDYVKATMLATGTSDELIRQGLTRLTTATGDAAKAQQLMNLALDVSAAGYGDVVSISTALSKAATGNATALRRLGVPLDANAVKAKDFSAIIADLNGRFRGQASAAANTYAGQLQRLSTAAGEAQESIGYALLGALNDVSKAFGGTNGAVDMVSGFGDATANLVTGVGMMATEIANLTAALQVNNQEGTDWGDNLRNYAIWAGAAFPPVALLAKGIEDVADQGAVLNAQKEAEARRLQVVTDRYSGYAAQIRGAAAATDDATGKILKQVSAVDRLKASLDRLNGNNRSVIANRIALRKAKQEGPTATGGKKGNIVTKDDRTSWGLNVAQQAEDLANSLAVKGQLDKARAVLDSNRQFLSGQFGKKFANNVLATPAWLDRGNQGQRAWGQRMQQGGTTNNYYFGDLMVRDAADAAEQARRAARLKALGTGRQAEAARLTAMAGGR